MTVRAILVAIIILFSAADRASATITARELLEVCGQLERNVPIQSLGLQVLGGKTFNGGKCWGYLNAFRDLHDLTYYEHNDPNQPLRACPLFYDLSVVKLIRLFLFEARHLPYDLNQPAVSIVAKVLAENFPCRY